METLKELAQLSPSIAALVVVAIFGYLMITKLLELFFKQAVMLDAINNNMSTNIISMDTNTKAISSNTDATKKMELAIEQLHAYYRQRPVS